MSTPTSESFCHEENILKQSNLYFTILRGRDLKTHSTIHEFVGPVVTINFNTCEITAVRVELKALMRVCTNPNSRTFQYCTILTKRRVTWGGGGAGGCPVGVKGKKPRPFSKRGN